METTALRLLLVAVLVALGACSSVTCEPPVVLPEEPPPNLPKLTKTVTVHAWCSVFQERPWQALCTTVDPLGVQHRWLAESTSISRPEEQPQGEQE